MKLAEANYYIYRMGCAFRKDLLVRSAFESEVFPTNQYICLSHVDQVFANPDRVRRILERTSAEELGALGRRLNAKAAQIYIWLVGHEYLIGREMLYSLGELSKRDKLEDLDLMLEFYTRVSAANRTDGAIQNSDVGGRDPVLSKPDIAALAAGVAELRDDGPAFRRAVAVLESFQFLAHADARIGISDNGPYSIGDGRQLLVKNLFDMRRNGQPYFETVRDRVPYNNVTFALALDDSVALEINDWGTALPREEGVNMLEQVTHAAAYQVDADGVPTLLSAAELGELAAATREAHRDLYRAVHQLDRRERIVQGALVYSRNTHPFAVQAACEQDLNWDLTEEALALLPRFEEDQQALDLFVASCVKANSASAYSMIPEEG